MKPTVTVTGVGGASAPPDLAVVQVGADCVARHASEALNEASAVLGRMRDVAVEAGVAAADLATSGMQLWPDHDKDGRPNGYRAALSMTVRVRDLVAATELVPALVAAGGDAGRLHSTTLVHSDPAGLAAAARDNAFADARQRAEQYAALAGMSLGEVIAVEESGADGGPVPISAQRWAAPALAASLPIEAGSDSVTAMVTVRWRLG
jgi:uncharacterized protein